MLFQIVDLGFRLVEGHVLDEDGLNQKIERVRPADGTPNQFVGFAIDLRRWGVLDSGGETLNQLAFLFGHFNSTLFLHDTPPEEGKFRNRSLPAPSVTEVRERSSALKSTTSLSMRGVCFEGDVSFLAGVIARGEIGCATGGRKKQAGSPTEPPNDNNQ